MTRVKQAHLLDPRLEVGSTTVSSVGRLFRHPEQLSRLHLDLRDVLLDDVERRVGVPVCELERQTLLERFEAVQDLEREGEGALVQAVEVRTAFYIAVRGRERVLDERVVRDLVTAMLKVSLASRRVLRPSTPSPCWEVQPLWGLGASHGQDATDPVQRRLVLGRDLLRAGRGRSRLFSSSGDRHGE